MSYPKNCFEDVIQLLDRMKNPMAEVHDENHAKKMSISDDFGLRSPVFRTRFRRKVTSMS